jgi:hypothetical protein
MTIRSNKNYDQHAHDQQTQASSWAAQSGEDYAAEVMAGSKAGAAPWYQSYDAHAARPNTPPSGPKGEYSSPSGSADVGFNNMTAEQHAARAKSGAGYVSKRNRPEYAAYYAEQDREDSAQERRME